MRILIVTNYQPPHMGGIEYAAVSLKRCWQDAGHQVTWLTTDLPRGGRASTPDNVRIPAANFFETLWQINSPLINPFSYPRIARLVAEHDAVSIHSLAPGLSTVTLFAALRSGKPTVATQHVGVIPMKAAFLGAVQKRFLCFAATWCTRRGALLTFVGNAVRAWFLQHAGVSRDNVVMTPAGIDQQDYHFVDEPEREQFRAKWQVDHNRFNVLFVGRFYEKKGLPLLREVALRCPDINFTLVGTGPIDPSAWDLPNIRTIGYVETSELRELYGSHDLFIMPSVGEGWPAVVPQAMACGLPCLISEETFQGFGQDSDRFLVCTRNVDVITNMLTEAAAGSIPVLENRRALSDYATATWDWKKTADIYLDLFRRLGS